MAKTYYSDFYPGSIASGVEGSTVPTPTPILTAPTTVKFTADYTGTLYSGQLPYSFNVIRGSGATDVSALTTWSITTSNCSATISSTGTITITAVSQSGQIYITSIYKDVILTASITIQKNTGSAPPSSTPGAGTTVTTNSSFPSTVAADYSSYNPTVLTLQAGSSGSITAAADLEINVTTGALGTYSAYGKWQYRAVGSGTWIDAGSEQAAQQAASVVFESAGS